MPVASPPTVLIVGAGPSGLVLALSLAQNGIPVRVVEKQLGPMLGQRGAAIQPRTLELFSHLGMVDEVLQRCMLLPSIRKYKSMGSFEDFQDMPIAPVMEPTPTNPFLMPIAIGQDSLEQILRTELERLGAYVEYGVEFISFKQSDEFVDVLLERRSIEGDEAEKESGQYQWLIGADGAKSHVRKQLGLAFLGETRTDDLIVGDIFIEGLDAKHWHLWGNPSDLLINIRATEVLGLYAFFIGGNNVTDKAALATDESGIRELFARQFPGLTFGKLAFSSLYKPNIRRVDSFGFGRVFVTGDAAHVHPPNGGQGLNAGVQDSVNLAWKLALVSKGRAPHKLLESYTEERIPVITEMLDMSAKLLAKEFGRDGGNMKPRSRSILQLGVNYRWSSLVLDESGQPPKEMDPYGNNSDSSLRAGDRAPDSNGLFPLVKTSSNISQLFEVFRPTYHTLVIFSDRFDCAEALQETSRYSKGTIKSIILVKQGKSVPDKADQADFVLEDREGHAYGAYVNASGCGLFLVRPDGMIGAILRRPQSIHQYFSLLHGTEK